MAGCSGSILAVGLLGCVRTCQMTPESSITRLNGTYRTVGTYHGQTDAVVREHQGRRAHHPSDQCFSGDHGAADGEFHPGRRHQKRYRWPEVASAREGRPANRARSGGPGRRHLDPPPSFAQVMPAIPTNGLARSSGIILAVRIIRLRGVSWSSGRVSSPHVPNIGIAGTVGKILAIRMLGHRRTCHTTPTGPMIHLSPADQMVCPARRPVGGPRARSAELLRGRNGKARRFPHRRWAQGRLLWAAVQHR
jgi:hypothetical protein